jgi:type I restriction enzyme S subunit
LGEVADYINGRAFKPEDWETSGLPIIRIENLTSSATAFNYYGAEVDPRYLVQDGDLLISWSASLDAYIWQRGEAILNQHIFKVAENSRLVTRQYLYYIVRHVMSDIRSQVHGTTMRHITRPEFNAIRIPLPPLDEQRGLVTILDEQLSHAERARRAVGQQLEAARALLPAYLRAAFESDEAKTWPSSRMGELAQVSGGIQKQPSRAPVSFHRPFLTVRNVQWGRLDLTDVEHFEVTEGELARYRLEPGDLLVVEGNGSKEQIGRCALFGGELQDCIHQNHIIRARPNGRLLVPEFARAYLASRRGRGQLMQKAETTTGLHTLSVSKVQSLEVPVPEIDVQERVAHQLAQENASCTNVSTKIDAVIQAIEQLPSGLLRQAFSGELVK